MYKIADVLIRGGIVDNVTASQLQGHWFNSELSLASVCSFTFLRFLGVL